MIERNTNVDNKSNLTNEIDWLLAEKYQGQKSAEFFVDCDRLASSEPLAYVIGHIPFLNTKIFLDSKPLIPRVETEFWVNQLIESYKNKIPPETILDLCAGSGCLGVALAKAFPQSTISFIELEETHHSTIRKNCQANGISNTSFAVYGGDLFTSLPPQKFSLIVSNPPYIDETLNRTEESVTKHEPLLALFAPMAGFSILERIINEAENWLTPSGELWLEHEPEHADLIKAAAGARFSTITYKDQYGALRFSKLVLQ